jgi:glycosyltransferase involved in cell wall biosynthesis
MLSVVAIGRNESDNLARLGESIAALRKFVDYPVEALFVDSASGDNSREIAQDWFDEVIELESSPHLCASAGRFAGTLEARYPWILYVDGDMELCREFFTVLADIDKLDQEFVGIIGAYIHRFDNGTMATQTFARALEQPIRAHQFGGAVVLRRQAVIEAGNWDPSIYGKEEMELYVRLGNGVPVVRFVNVPMVYHYSEYYSRVQLVLRLLTPSAGLGKVFWGYGQTIRALSIKQKLLAMIRLEYEAYVFWVGMLLALLVGSVWGWQFGLLIVAITVFAFSLWVRPGSIIRYMTLPLSLVSGWFRYFPWFRPRLLRWGSSKTTAS